MQTQKFTNHLINETSPYLLQHAHNPVDWYPWSEEALQKAKNEDKPILVSIGYAACHWCHVMEKESFEDEATAEIMNEYFINIKIDREERPDLDHIYMDAVQAMTGSGGWPLNVFLTPEAKPFYGGTYFPPVRAYNHLSWKETLQAIHEAYTKRRSEVDTQAENLIEHIITANSFGVSRPAENQTTGFFSNEDLQKIADNILNSADTVWGGFGGAPKFPQTFVIQYLLRHYHFTDHEPSLIQALLSLDKMIQGGTYDQLGGGFARYSTDEKWLAPHFEKMLYDNALLINVLAEAYQLTSNELYAHAIKETIHFVQEELSSPDGGFYSALDADSEGVEGKYYVWSKQEIENVLKEDADIFCKVYDVSETGNWEHTNILWLPKPIKEWAETLSIDESLLRDKLDTCKQKLLAQRKKRTRPLLDDKILLGWNTLMITACCKAYASIGNDAYLELALKNISFLEENLCEDIDKWYHTWKGGKAKYPAFLDDHAFLVQAYIHLQEVTGNSEYLIAAKKIADRVLELFADNDTNFFWFTSSNQNDVIVRKKEIYDGAVPSGNAVMALNLLYLAIVFDIREWKTKAEAMIQSLAQAIINYSTSFGVWAMCMQQLITGLNEIAITGPKAMKLLSNVNRLFIPNKVIQIALTPSEEFPLLKGKLISVNKNLIYLCRDYSCQQPVETFEELVLLLKK
jgi:uncharacterized protein